MFQFSPGLSFRFPETCLKAPETRSGIGSTQRTGHTGGPEGEPVSFKAWWSVNEKRVLLFIVRTICM